MTEGNKRVRKARMVKDQPNDRLVFSRVLDKQIKAKGLRPSDVAQQTGLREETIRSYLRAQNRPNPESLSLLRLVLGDAVAEPYLDTPLTSGEVRNYWVSYVNATTVILHVTAPMSPLAAQAVIEVLEKHGVSEIRAA